MHSNETMCQQEAPQRHKIAINLSLETIMCIRVHPRTTFILESNLRGQVRVFVITWCRLLSVCCELNLHTLVSVPLTVELVIALCTEHVVNMGKKKTAPAPKAPDGPPAGDAEPFDMVFHCQVCLLVHQIIQIVLDVSCQLHRSGLRLFFIQDDLLIVFHSHSMLYFY